MEVRLSKKKNADQFPVIVVLNCGELFFTARAAKELRDKLSNVLAQIEKASRTNPASQLGGIDIISILL